MGEFGDRMKIFEAQESDRRFLPLLPICARLDGKCFSKFTKDMDRPYDKKMSDLMIEVTKYLVEETNACMGYTQSDEISLVWYSDDIKSQIFMDGRIQKMTSILAAMASVRFNSLLPQYFPNKVDKEPVLDCRVWSCPTLMEATNQLLWREQDAAKNSISMAARHY
jgi:tRNA(His) 5'-end guanylyltransferase